jgi:hypothetical protein
MSEKTFDKSPAEQIDEVLNRWTVTDLRELSDEDLDRGLERYNRRGDRVDVRSSGETNLIRWWDVVSNDHLYQVRRFENFAWCSCLDFHYNKTACRHIAATTQAWREERNREADNAPYLGPNRKPSERVGRVRI